MESSIFYDETKQGCCHDDAAESRQLVASWEAREATIRVEIILHSHENQKSLN